MVLTKRQKRKVLDKLAKALDDYLEPSGGWTEFINDSAYNKLSKAEYDWAVNHTFPAVRTFERLEG